MYPTMRRSSLKFSKDLRSTSLHDLTNVEETTSGVNHGEIKSTRGDTGRRRSGGYC